MGSGAIVTVTADDTAGIEAARALLAEYHAWLGDLVCADTLAEEAAALPAPYVAPEGRLLLGRGSGGEPVGVVGIRRHPTGHAEMKRLYVAPEARGAGWGRRLALSAIAAAEELGYSAVLLTTVPELMAEAVALYRDLGFAESGPFEDLSRVRDADRLLYMRLALPRGQ